MATDESHSTKPGQEIDIPEPLPLISTIWQFSGRFFFDLSSPLWVLILAAGASAVSKLALAPTYGGAASSTDHDRWIHLTFAWAFWVYAKSYPFNQYFWPEVWPLVPIAVAWAPALQYFLLPFHHWLGPIPFWPVWAGFLERDILIACCATAFANGLADLGITYARENKFPATMLLIGGSLLSFWSIEPGVSSLVHEFLIKVPSLTPVHLQVGLVFCSAIVFRSDRHARLFTIVLFAVPPMLYALYWNPRSSSSAVDAALRQHNWTLIERRWSNTGYISVLDSFNSEYRVMRCDHSLLGGEWLLTDERRTEQGWQVNEPIYAVFQMLEAVRLIELDPPIQDSSASALVIGLGIGTAPKALLAHGINTTVVELDPVVHEFATKYYNLPTNHTAILSDAVSWAQTEATSLNPNQYDYILHDVFTGGSEPLALFTSEFLSNLRALLRPNGVIALNYAGDPDSPLTKSVLYTILTTFSNQCRIFRDHAKDPSDKDNFSNIVLFCRNSPGPITFRQPSKRDYLRSHSRKLYMLPKPELELSLPARTKDVKILKKRGLRSLSNQQAQAGSAVRHWYIMRTVLPDAVWDLW